MGILLLNRHPATHPTPVGIPCIEQPREPPMSEMPEMQWLKHKANTSSPPETSTAQDAARIALGLTLILAGTSHLTFARKAFKAQVPPWVPLKPDTVVLESGVVEIAPGHRTGRPAAAQTARRQHRRSLLYRYLPRQFSPVHPPSQRFRPRHRPQSALARLFFQPVLVAWALWSTGALRRK